MFWCQSEYSKYLDMQKVSRQSYFYEGKKCEKTLERARMLMRTKVSMHVESIVLLSRKTCRPAKDYIKVGIDAEEYYDIKAVNKEWFLER